MSMIVVSTCVSITLLGVFLAAVFVVRFLLAAGFDTLATLRRTLETAFFGAARFAVFLRADFVALVAARRNFEMAFFGVARFVAFLRAGFVALIAARRTLETVFLVVARFAAFLPADLAPVVLRFEVFLRAGTRFADLAIAIPCDR